MDKAIGLTTLAGMFGLGLGFAAHPWFCGLGALLIFGMGIVGAYRVAHEARAETCPRCGGSHWQHRSGCVLA